MPDCPAISVRYRGDLKAKLEEARGFIEGVDAGINGDETGGTFWGNAPYLGHIEGSYSVSGDAITFHISERPQIVSCRIIEGEIGNFFSR